MAAALHREKRHERLREFVLALPAPAPALWARLFLSAVEHADFDCARACIERCSDERRRVDFLRVFAHTAIARRQLGALFRHCEGAVAAASNELLCGSVATVAAGALLQYRIGDAAEAAAALYFYARTLLRTVSRLGLQRAAAALVLCLALRADGAVRGVADGALVSRKAILRLLRRVEAVLALPDAERKCRGDRPAILRALVENAKWEAVLAFARTCTAEELAALCAEIARGGTQTGLLARLLDLDKRKWNFALHAAALQGFFGRNCDPPAWLLDRMAEEALPQLIDACCRAKRADVLADVLEAVSEKGASISRYFTPLLEKARAVCTPDVHGVIDRLIAQAV
jgi:hypothetical protein